MQLGWFNVDAMLESGDAGQLESWYEYALHFEHFGHDWRRTSMATARTVNVIKSEANSFKPNVMPSARDLFNDEFMVPKVRKKEPTKHEQRAAAVENLEKLKGLPGG